MRPSVGGRRRTIDRKTLLVAGGWLIGAALFGAILLLLAQFWAPVLFWGYVTAALLAFVAILISSFLNFRQRDLLDPLSIDSAMIRAQVLASPFRSLRFYTFQIMTSLSGALAWPPTFLVGAGAMVRHDIGKLKMGSRAFLASSTLNAPIAAVSVATAITVLITVSTDWFLSPGTGYRQIFVLLLALAVMTRNLAFVISFQPLPTILRRSIGDPYFRFVAVAVAQLVTLVLALAAYSAWEAGEQLKVEHLRSIAVSMLTLSKLRAAVSSGQALTWPDLLVSTAGGLYLVSGFKTIFEHKEFNREVDDLHSIAGNQLALGKHREARRWLDKVQKPEGMTYTLYAAVYLASGDAEKAERMVESLLDEKKIDPPHRPNERIRVLISIASGTPMPKEQLTALLRRWLSAGYQDLFLSDGVSTILAQKLLTPQEVLELFPTDEMINQHVLSWSYAMLYSGSLESPRPILRQHKTANDIEELVRICLLYQFLLVDYLGQPTDALTKEIEIWENDDSVKLPELARKANTDFERLLVVGGLYAIHGLAEATGSPLVAQISELAEEVKDEFGGDPTILTNLRALEGMHIAMQRQLRELMRT